MREIEPLQVGNHTFDYAEQSQYNQDKYLLYDEKKDEPIGMLSFDNDTIYSFNYRNLKTLTEIANKIGFNFKMIQ